MLKRFISYYKPHKKMLALDMLAALCISLIGMVYPIVTNKMLNIYIPQKMYTTIVIAGAVVLALGNSARDTFRMLRDLREMKKRIKKASI